jgi:hypothetical protein
MVMWVCFEHDLEQWREVFVERFTPFYQSKGWCPELAKRRARELFDKLVEQEECCGCCGCGQ